MATPGLTALVLYLRPAQRAGVVSCLVELGLFVREFDLTNTHSAWAFNEDSPEIVVIYPGSQFEHRDLVRSAIDTGNVAITVVQDGAAEEEYRQLGAAAVIRESEIPGALRDALVSAGEIARRRRQTLFPAQVPATVIFGSLHFRITQPWLSRGREMTALSPTEHGVLRALVGARGTVVSKDVLGRYVSGSDEPASDGYLKTVVLRIRRKVDRLGGDSSLLGSVRGSGYILRA